jgi:hypothetical protein
VNRTGYIAGACFGCLNSMNELGLLWLMFISLIHFYGNLNFKIKCGYVFENLCCHVRPLGVRR